MATIKSIKEKAKRYDEAVKKLKVLHDNWATTQNRAAKEVEEIFPEFAEPKDERIMKIIRQSLKSYFEGKLSIGTNDVDYAICLSWLKKQGNLMKALQISNARIGELIEENYYLKEQLEKQDNNMGISEATKQKVEDNLNKALEKEIPESCNEFLDEQGEQPKKHDVCDNCDQQGSCVSPCPMKLVEKQGEHKPVFEMKTPEESLGIDSDTYNKIVDECIYGEQKPIKEHNACEFCEDRYGCVNPCSMKLVEEEKFTDKVEPKFKVGDKIYLKPEYRIPDDDTPIANTVFEIRAIDDKHYRFDGSYIFIEDQDKYELVEQKPAWNEKYIADVFEKVGLAKIVREQSNDNLTNALQSAMIELSKFTPQPKHEWSEEDKRKIDRIYSILRQASDTRAFSTSCRLIGDKECIELQDFLKSIRPQTTWKPSDEQMNALHYVTNFDYGGHKATLVSLYEQLKKLK